MMPSSPTSARTVNSRARGLVEFVFECDLACQRELADQVVLAGPVEAVFQHRLEQQMHGLDHRARFLSAIEVAELDQSLPERAVVTFDQRASELEIGAANRFGIVANRSEVENADARMVCHQIVARMRVGVEHAEFEQLPPDQLVIFARDPRAQLEVGRRIHQVREMITVQISHRQHAA